MGKVAQNEKMRKLQVFKKQETSCAGAFSRLLSNQHTNSGAYGQRAGERESQRNVNADKLEFLLSKQP